MQATAGGFFNPPSLCQMAVQKFFLWGSYFNQSLDQSYPPPDAGL